jgi:hypothetical protein
MARRLTIRKKLVEEGFQAVILDEVGSFIIPGCV